MLKKFKYFIAVVALFFVMIAPAVMAQNSLPELIQDETSQIIKADRFEPLFVYFGYGDPASTYDVSNVSVKLTLEGDGLKFDPQNQYDLYSSDEDQKNDILTCSPVSTIDSYNINESFVSNKEIIYGPGTADNDGGEIKSSIVQEQIGCLRIGLITESDAQDGQIVKLTYEVVDNRDINGEVKSPEQPFYKRGDEPTRKVIYFRIGELLECEVGQSIVFGQCEQTCEVNEYIDIEGKCQTIALECEQGFEGFDGECLKECLENTARNSFGRCKEIKGDRSSEFSLGVTIFVSIIGLFFFLVMANNISKILH